MAKGNSNKKALPRKQSGGNPRNAGREKSIHIEWMERSLSSDDKRDLEKYPFLSWEMLVYPNERLAKKGSGALFGLTPRADSVTTLRPQVYRARYNKYIDACAEELRLKGRGPSQKEISNAYLREQEMSIVVRVEYDYASLNPQFETPFRGDASVPEAAGEFQTLAFYFFQTVHLFDEGRRVSLGLQGFVDLLDRPNTPVRRQVELLLYDYKRAVQQHWWAEWILRNPKEVFPNIATGTRELIVDGIRASLLAEEAS